MMLFLRIDTRRYMMNNCISNNAKIMIPRLDVGTVLQILSFSFDLFLHINYAYVPYYEVLRKVMSRY